MVPNVLASGVPGEKSFTSGSLHQRSAKEQAGPKAAAILSVVESCRRLQVPVRDYFSTVLPGLADLPIRCFQTLLHCVGRPAFIDASDRGI
jgi:hypothetical protein